MTKKKIYKIKSHICEADIQIMNSSKISEVITSREKDLQPYWNVSCLEESERLLSHTETGFAGSDLNSLSSWPVSLTQQSWFSMNHLCHLNKKLLEASSLSSMFSPLEFINCESTINRSKKIRIYPRKESKQLLKNYLGLSRYWYNQTIEYLKQKGTKAILSEVRKIQNNDHPSWAFECPQRIRDHAINQACKAVANAKRKYLKTKQFQEVKFKSKRFPKQGFGFDKISLKENFVFQRRNRCYFNSTEEINTELEGTRIIIENDRWFLILPQKRQIKIPENQRFGIAALDPGVRTFQTYYSEFLHGKIGEQAFTKIYRLCLSLDKVISKMSKSKNKQSLKKASRKIRWKIKDLINDLHHKTASFLVKNFDVILIPTFKTSDMVKKLNSRVSRQMLTFAHYRFKQFLKAKAEEYSCLVIEVNEAYTSKTCSYCGKIQNIGGKKVMRCDCGAIVDRDYNGSRGIYLRELVASPIQTGNRLYKYITKI